MLEDVKVRVLPDGRIARKDSADYLGKAPKTLADWSSRGIGPMPRKCGGRIFYRLRDLEAFVETGAREAI